MISTVAILYGPAKVAIGESGGRPLEGFVSSQPRPAAIAPALLREKTAHSAECGDAPVRTDDKTTLPISRPMRTSNRSSGNQAPIAQIKGRADASNSLTMLFHKKTFINTCNRPA